jgi:Mlc titration factor MtfA (ptsG expression regulator)
MDGSVMVVLMGLLLLMIALGILSVFYDIWKHIHQKALDSIAILKPLSASRKATLNKYFFYYNQLSIIDQKKFEQRVNRFLYVKRFIGRGIVVTEEMKVLSSATAVLLSFGMPMVTLAHFDKILLYPDEYYSNINRNYHLGEVNPRLGIIILSWRHFVEGFFDNQDGRNLAFHEMAHAIHFENLIRNEEYNFLDEEALETWDNLAVKEITQIKNNPDHYLRAYASTNQHEFFAVSVEYFFEDGQNFKSKLPKLYDTLCKILGIDPITLFKL